MTDAPLEESLRTRIITDIDELAILDGYCFRSGGFHI